MSSSRYCNNHLNSKNGLRVQTQVRLSFKDMQIGKVSSLWFPVSSLKLIWTLVSIQRGKACSSLWTEMLSMFVKFKPEYQCPSSIQMYAFLINIFPTHVFWTHAFVEQMTLWAYKCSPFQSCGNSVLKLLSGMKVI